MILKPVRSVQPTSLYTLLISFSPEEYFEYDVSHYLSKGVYRELLDPDKFKKVGIDPVSKTVTWFNGLDISPIVLYQEYIKYFAS